VHLELVKRVYLFARSGMLPTASATTFGLGPEDLRG